MAKVNVLKVGTQIRNYIKKNASVQNFRMWSLSKAKTIYMHVKRWYCGGEFHDELRFLTISS